MGRPETKKKLLLISWKKITKPKKKGGLGLLAANEKNKVLLAKLNWRFHKEKDSLWARVLSQKYLRRRLIPKSLWRCASSKIWSAMSNGNDVFRQGSKWIVGKDSNLSFWFDKWLDKGPLKSLIHGPLQREEDFLHIKDMVSTMVWTGLSAHFLFRETSYWMSNIRSGAGIKGQIYATNQCLPRHTFNEKSIQPITHNYIPHTRIIEQTLSNTPKPIPPNPLLLPSNRSSTLPLVPPHTLIWSWRSRTEPQGLF